MTELQIGEVVDAAILLVGVVFVTLIVPKIAMKKSWHTWSAIFAGFMATGVYVAAALEAKAVFPDFLREHPFDGLALGAVLGWIFDRYAEQR